jgi:acylphosphatase
MSQLSVSVSVNGVTYNYAADNLTTARSIVNGTIELAEGGQVRANVWAYVEGQAVLLPHNVTELNVWNLELANA